MFTTNNSKLSISHIKKTTIRMYGLQQLHFEKVYQVPGLNKNLMSVPQLTAEGNYALFGPKEERGCHFFGK